MEATRQLGWKIFAEVVEPISFVTRTNEGRMLRGQVPRFLTWFTAEDAQRWFRYALQQSRLSMIEAGQPLTDATIHDADLFLARELDTMPEPLQNRLKTWFEQHPEPTLQDWSGIGGTSRIYYSPDMIHAVLQNYAELGKCFEGLKRPSALEESSSCFTREWPRAAAIVKAAWWNGKSPLKTYPTDAASLQKLMQTPDGSWTQLAQEQAMPDSMFSVNVGSAQLFLPGLHIMTKDQKDWVWITAWWSADPDGDFGSDRPDFIKDLGPLFHRYKICAVTRFQDDAADWDELAQKYPDLVAALNAARNGNPGASWCSNPYLEFGAHNQRTNCIGCHQFAGTDARQENILQDAIQFPQHGSRRQRSTFVTDYVWSAALGGQSLHQLIYRNLNWRKTLPEK
ncbi:hypothetical protein [Oligoflexus tunisiensis]|uniref:hypothetical protein n=1 Tax=Oligoflexus tunisiensis TaxID=708132 RepID=UPI001C403D15|nr:hypothetical protein [Oligoflexus tunisiensis]